MNNVSFRELYELPCMVMMCVAENSNSSSCEDEAWWMESKGIDYAC